MACIDCLDDQRADIRMPCKVCELNNGDTTVKRVKWCKICQAYICDEHRPDAVERLKAAALNLASNIKESIRKKKNNDVTETENTA